MKKNKILFHIIFFIIIVFCFYFIFLNLKFNQVPNSLTLTVQSVKEETKLYKISAEYPQFEGRDKLNSEIKSVVDDKISHFKKNASENWAERKKTSLPGENISEFPESPWPMSIYWTPEQLNPRYISLIIRFDSYQGGANEMQEIETINYDLVNGRKIYPEDLFLGKSDYLKTVSDYAKKDLIGQFQGNCIGDQNVPVDMIESGTGPEVKNFTRFTFNENAITFYFPKYQVAPGAYGEQKVIMPKNLK